MPVVANGMLRIQRVEQVLDKKAAHPTARNMSEIAYLVTGFGSGLMSAMDHPKALGDVLESLIGAVLVDSDFSLDKAHQVRHCHQCLSILAFCCTHHKLVQTAVTASCQLLASLL